jgi:predicted O-methyltransferase YrrM
VNPIAPVEPVGPKAGITTRIDIARSLSHFVARVALKSLSDPCDTFDHAMTMESLMREVEQCIPGSGWCSEEKGKFLAQLIVEQRPTTVVEIGVWQGGSLIPMLLALHENAHGKAIAIDPWDPNVSRIGEIQVNADWWGSQNHEQALQIFRDRMAHYGVTNYCEIWRKPSDDCEPPAKIDLLHIDGSHVEQAFRDAQRFLPSVVPNGIAILDDVGWTGGHVERAVELAYTLGFVALRPLGTGIVMRRGAP